MRLRRPIYERNANYSVIPNRRLAHPKFHWLWGRDEEMREHYRLDPWWLRLLVGFASLADGWGAVWTLGLVTSAYVTDTAFYALGWGLDKMNREASDGVDYNETSL